MKLQDNLKISPEVYGIFSFKSFDKDGNLIDDYTDKNLIVYSARAVMAGQIADLVGVRDIQPINRFVIGTRGHLGEDILNPLQVGDENPVYGIFSPERTMLFSEESDEFNYHVSFNPTGDIVVEQNGLTGIMKEGRTTLREDDATNSVIREVTGARENELKYTITIEAPNANMPGRAIPYTEAALYAGDNLFAMKTFPARVKENTVKFVITWSIIF